MLLLVSYNTVPFCINIHLIGCVDIVSMWGMLGVGRNLHTLFFLYVLIN